ncbi:unnamed protein product, partial [Scytosiphon promiscuus]
AAVVTLAFCSLLNCDLRLTGTKPRLYRKVLGRILWRRNFGHGISTAPKIRGATTVEKSGCATHQRSSLPPW